LFINVFSLLATHWVAISPHPSDKRSSRHMKDNTSV